VSSGPPLSVLLVDDEEVTRLIGKSLLEMSGHVVTCCNSGRAAVEAAERSAFDLILMDIHMPGMTGIEATRRIKTRRATCHIVALTASADPTPEEREQYDAAGLDAWLTKPLRRGMVESVLAEFEALRRPALLPPERPEGLIDRTQMQAIAEALPRTKVREILQQAGQSMVETATLLREAWHNQDGVSAARCAHRLAGAASNFGCAALARVAGQIESDCKSGGIGRRFSEQFEKTFQATLGVLQTEWEG
jgi:two-component system sensor histidine kinase TorS